MHHHNQEMYSLLAHCTTALISPSPEQAAVAEAMRCRMQPDAVLPGVVYAHQKQGDADKVHMTRHMLAAADCRRRACAPVQGQMLQALPALPASRFTRPAGPRCQKCCCCLHWMPQIFWTGAVVHDMQCAATAHCSWQRPTNQPGHCMHLQ